MSRLFKPALVCLVLLFSAAQTLGRAQDAPAGSGGAAPSPLRENAESAPAPGSDQVALAGDGESGVLRWKFLGSAGFTPGAANHPRLVVDGQGRVLVAYGDSANGGRATVMRFSGGAWSPVGSPGFSPGQILWPGIALDAQDRPYFLFQDAANGYRATVMRFDGSAWVLVGSAGFSASSVDWTDIALDAQDTPYVAYADASRSGKPTVKRFDGSAWVNVSSPGFSGGGVQNLNLVLDSHGLPYLGYVEESPWNATAVIRFDGSAWQLVGERGFTGGSSNLGLAIDARDVPYVSYNASSHDGKAEVDRFDGTSWVPVGTPGFSAGGGGCHSLAVAPGGALLLAYVDLGYDSRATVMRYDGVDWAPVGSPGFSEDHIEWLDMAPDPFGTPTVSFKATFGDAKASALRLDRPVALRVLPAAVEMSLPEGSHSTATLEVCAGGTETLSWNVNGTQVLWDNGPLVTHIGTGYSGSDASAVQTNLGMSTYGFGNMADDGYRMADEFIVDDPLGWDVEQVTFYAYQTDTYNYPPHSPITDLYYQVWDGLPEQSGSSIVFGDLHTNRKLSSGWTGAYRTLNTGLTDAQRPVMATLASAGVHLAAGTYWLDWTTDGARESGPWAPPVSILGQTTTGDALQRTPSGWTLALDAGTGTWQGMPFVVEGTPVRPAVPWLTKSPAQGSLSPGQCATVTLVLDTAGLPLGDYSAELYFNGNDLLTPQIVVPVRLTVFEWLPTDWLYFPSALSGW